MSAINPSSQAGNQALLISIIVPVFNRAQVLHTCLESILAQDYRPLELILVDNGSEDKSLELCKQFQQEQQKPDFEIRVLQESKPGACSARNRGYAQSKGDYLLFFDSDDRMYPDHCSSLLGSAALQNYPALLACQADILADKRRFVFPKRIHDHPAAQLFDPVLKTASCAIRRDLMEQIGPWNEDLQRWQDLEFGFRLLLHAEEVCWIVRPLFYSAVLADSISAHSYTVDQLEMNRSLDLIRLSIDQQAEENQAILLKALAFKTVSMSAMLYREKSYDLASRYYQKGLGLCPDPASKTLLKLHYLYTRHGGRGFWRLAEKILSRGSI